MATDLAFVPVEPRGCTRRRRRAEVAERGNLGISNVKEQRLAAPEGGNGASLLDYTSSYNSRGESDASKSVQAFVSLFVTSVVSCSGVHIAAVTIDSSLP